MKRFYPKIYVSKSGKRYFVVNERKVYINSKLTKKEIMSIYNLLKKNIKSKAKKQTNRTASTIININTEPQNRKRRRTRKSSKKERNPFVSTIRPENRVSSTHGISYDHHPKDSGDKDLINKLINDKNKSEEVKRGNNEEKKRDEEKKNLLQNQLIPYDYSRQGRLKQLYNDPEFIRLTLGLQIGTATKEDFRPLSIKYGFEDEFEHNFQKINKKKKYLKLLII